MSSSAGTRPQVCKSLKIASTLAVCLALTGCSGASSGTPVAGNTCGMNSDCAQGLTCSFGHCQSACKEARDCPNGEQCVKDSSGINSCLLPASETCNYSSQCPLPLVCATDLKCRNQCLADRDCATATQKCVLPDGVCAEPDAIGGNGSLINAVVDAGAPDLGGASDTSPDLAPDVSPDSPVVQVDAPPADRVPDVAAAPPAPDTAPQRVDGPATGPGPDAAAAAPLSSFNLLMGTQSFQFSCEAVSQSNQLSLATPNDPMGTGESCSWPASGPQIFIWLILSNIPASAGPPVGAFTLSPQGGVSNWLQVILKASPIETIGSDTQYSVTSGTISVSRVPAGATGSVLFRFDLRNVQFTANGGYGQTDGGLPDITVVSATLYWIYPSTLSPGALDAGANGPALALDTTSASFAAVVGQASSPPVVINVVNFSSVDATISPKVTGAGFAISSNCTTVPANGSCAIALTFTPSSEAPATGSLNVTSTLQVPLTGNGVSPDNLFSVNGGQAVDLGTLNQGTTKAGTVYVSLNNNYLGLTDLSCKISGPDLKVDAKNTTCGATLANNCMPGLDPNCGSCTFAFTFTATNAVAGADSVTCTADGVSHTIQVSATVIPPTALSISPTTNLFGVVPVGLTSLATFQVSNAGYLATGNPSVTLAGANADQFSIDQNSCTAHLFPFGQNGSTCGVSVVFSPTSTDVQTATLTITDANAPSTPATATLIGNDPPEVLAISPASQDFGSVAVGQQSAATTFTVTNTGGISFPLYVGATDSQFVTTSDHCTGVMLATNQSCTVAVALKPNSLGAESASLWVQVPAGAVIASANLTGVGTSGP